jgi:hypothetical protein
MKSELNQTGSEGRSWVSLARPSSGAVRSQESARRFCGSIGLHAHPWASSPPIWSLHFVSSRYLNVLTCSLILHQQVRVFKLRAENARCDEAALVPSRPAPIKGPPNS